MPLVTQPLEWEGLIEQSHVCWYHDDGGLDVASPLSAVDAVASVAQGGVARVRVQVHVVDLEYDYDPTNLDLASFRYALAYRVSGDGGGSWGPWELVGSSTAGVRVWDSAYFEDGAAVDMSRLPAPASGAVFVAGEAVESARATEVLSMAGGQYTELEWCVRFVGANVGELYAFKVVAVSIAGDSYYELSAYHVYAQVVITAQESEDGTMFFEQYTRAGWGFEKGNERSGRWVKAQQSFNLLRRLPIPNVEQFAYGGFRGTEVPVGYRAGRFSDQRLTIECELTLDTVSYLLACFFGAPATTGTGPYTHSFYASANPNKAGRTLTVWQRLHDAASGAPAGEKLIGYGGVAVETLRLRGEQGARGGLLSVEASASFLSAVEAAEDGTICTAAYGGELPLVVDDIVLTLRDSSGNAPQFAPDVARIDLTLSRTVFIRREFSGRYIPVGYYWREPRVTGLELEVYRTTNVPVRLVWGNSGAEPFVPTTSESGRRYAPSGTASALVLEFRSQTNAAHKMTIEIPNLHFLSAQERSMDGAVYDTLMVMPVYSASDKTNLRKVELVNAQSGIIPSDASIQQVGTGITGVYSPY